MLTRPEPSHDVDRHSVQTGSGRTRHPCLPTGNSVSLFRHGMCRKPETMYRAQDVPLFPMMHLGSGSRNLGGNQHFGVRAGLAASEADMGCWLKDDGQLVLMPMYFCFGWWDVGGAGTTISIKSHMHRRLLCSFHAYFFGWVVPQHDAPAWGGRRRRLESPPCRPMLSPHCPHQVAETRAVK